MPGFRIFLLALALVGGGVLGAQVLSEEPSEVGTLLLPGRMPWGATGLPSGEVLVPSEDQVVRVIDHQARVVTQWRAPARIAGPVAVGPAGPQTLVAVPLVTGRVVFLAWSSEGPRLTESWATDHSAIPTATAWSASGTAYVAWADRIEAWAPGGRLLWRSAGAGIAGLLVDESRGLYALGNGVELYDQRGVAVASWPLDAPVRGALQTLGGTLYCWTSTGLWKRENDRGFTKLDPSDELLGVVVDRQEGLILTEPGRIRRIGNDGRLLSSLALPRPAVVASVIDDRGRVLVGTTEGLEAWTYDGRFLGTLDPSPPVASLLMTSRGLGVWGGLDWKVRVWKGFKLPPFGWSQPGGSPSRAWSTRGPATLASRSVVWAEDGEFGLYLQWASSGEEDLQSRALDGLEARDKPWANLVLLKVARSGLSDLFIHENRVTNNWPQNRLRALRLLAARIGVEDRDELLAILSKEFDPAVVAQGFIDLGRSGWDGDGKLLRLIAEVQGRMPRQAVVADAAIDAARMIWEANGRSTDPSLVPLVTAVFQGPFPRTVKAKAQELFQDLVTGP